MSDPKIDRLAVGNCGLSHALHPVRLPEDQVVVPPHLPGDDGAFPLHLEDPISTIAPIVLGTALSELTDFPTDPFRRDKIAANAADWMLTAMIEALGIALSSEMAPRLGPEIRIVLGMQTATGNVTETETAIVNVTEIGIVTVVIGIKTRNVTRVRHGKSEKQLAANRHRALAAILYQTICLLDLTYYVPGRSPVGM
jgi:hypothetical protein